MQFVPSNQIREGMCVAETVRDDQGRTLIARGQRLGFHHIDRLRKFKIESIFIDPNNGEAVVKPTSSELRDQCLEVLSSSFGQLSSEFSNKRIALDQKAINLVSNTLVEALMKSKNPLVTLLDVDCNGDRSLQHAVNSAVLSIVIAIDLKVPEPMMNDLAVAMLFHDVGLVFLPDEVTQKNGPLNQAEIQQIRQHPQLGFEHLLRSNAISPVAANIVLRHHEYLNGTGYPNGVPAEKLSILMKIASVSEIYDALTTPRYGATAYLPDAAVSYLLQNIGTHFAKEVVLALCHRVALYPNGICVQLNSGEYGVVAGTLPKTPLRPVVLLKRDRAGKALKEDLIVNLSEERNRSIIRSSRDMDVLVNTRAGMDPVDPFYASLA